MLILTTLTVLVVSLVYIVAIVDFVLSLFSIIILSTGLFLNNIYRYCLNRKSVLYNLHYVAYESYRETLYISFWPRGAPLCVYK